MKNSVYPLQHGTNPIESFVESSLNHSSDTQLVQPNLNIWYFVGLVTK